MGERKMTEGHFTENHRLSHTNPNENRACSHVFRTAREHARILWTRMLTFREIPVKNKMTISTESSPY